MATFEIVLGPLARVSNGLIVTGRRKLGLAETEAAV
jgi:hypothetical protein